MAFLKRLLRALPLTAALAVASWRSAVALALTDLRLEAVRRTRHAPRRAPRRAMRRLRRDPQLERQRPAGEIPALVIDSACRQPGNEILVVDNGSTDGSADFVRERLSRT